MGASAQSHTLASPPLRTKLKEVTDSRPCLSPWFDQAATIRRQQILEGVTHLEAAQTSNNAKPML